ncbi:MAG: phosphomannomutase [Verrucomicrobiota bacterium]|nr:phosphomannomutase [Verrucomicrobiota bacterium]
MMIQKNHENEINFRGQYPTQLKFGTSGLRGLVEDMTDLEVYINATGFLDHLIEKRVVQVGNAICIAGDLRPSTHSAERSILRVVARSIKDAGLRIRYLGKIPTPALTCFAMHHGEASIMVTGSHIPFDRNGIKFNKPSGEVLKSDESVILSAVLAARRLQYAMPSERSLFDNSGWFKSEAIVDLPEAENQASAFYLGRYRDFFPSHCLREKRLLVYQHSAVGRDLLVELLTSLGAHVTPVGRSETFVPIDTENITTEQLKQLQTFVDKHAENEKPFDAVISTDGDSDRPLVCGIDAWGSVHCINGDLLGLLTADFLEAHAVVVPISTNDAVDQYFKTKEIQPYKTKIGSPHVIQTMEALRHEGIQQVMGWEANGGFLTMNDLEIDEGKLSALPTRDAFLPILSVLHTSVEKGMSLIDLLGTLPARFGRSGLIDAFPKASSQSLMKRWTPDIRGLLDWELKDGNVQLRLTTGERRTADHEECLMIAHLCEEADRYFLPDLGYESIERINYIDGIRFYFKNGDIGHIRASGNAPQLRFYAVAETQDRADSMVANAILEPGGLLRTMENET